MRAYIYTTFEQTEEPQAVHHVVAISAVGDGLLSIEAEKNENGVRFSAFHRYEPGKWARFTVGSDSPLAAASHEETR